MGGSQVPLPELPDTPGVDAPFGQWLREAREGSPTALGRALEAGRTYLLFVANRALDDKLKAKVGASDLVQDTFLAAQRDFGAFRGTTEEDFFGWLTGILAHRLANNVRRYCQAQCRDVGREVPVESVHGDLGKLAEVAHTPGAILVEQEEQRRVRLALARLAEPYRSVLIERTWQGASYAEIAQRHGCSAEAARKTWARALRRLQKLLTQIE